MWDYYVKLYLYLLIISSLIFIFLYSLLWLFQQWTPKLTKYVWRNVLQLAVGVLSLIIFNSGRVASWMLLLMATALLLGGIYCLEAIEKHRSRRENAHRTT